MRTTKKEKLDFIIRLLQKQALNRRQLQTELGCTLHSVDKYVIELMEEKLIFIEFWQRTRSKPLPHYRAGNKLSNPKPVAIDRKTYNKMYREKKLNDLKLEEETLQPKPFVPKRDIAASWF